MQAIVLNSFIETSGVPLNKISQEISYLSSTIVSINKLGSSDFRFGSLTGNGSEPKTKFIARLELSPRLNGSLPAKGAQGMQWELVTLVVFIPLGLLVLAFVLIWNFGYVGAVIATVLITLLLQVVGHILSGFGRPNADMPSYAFTIRKIVKIFLLAALIFGITTGLVFLKEHYL